MRKVITYGTFDLFHQGHYNILKRAKEQGDYLIVGVTSESYDIERGKLSVKDSLTKRMENVLNTGFVDEVIIEEYLGQKIRDIIKYDIDVLVIGDDWKGKFDHLRKYCDVVYLERTKNISSTQIREENGNIFRIGISSDKLDDNNLINEVKYVSGLHVENVYTKDIELGKNYCDKYAIDRYHTDFEEFAEGIDIVIVMNDINERADIVRKALESGKHVITEAPITKDKTVLKELLNLSNENGLALIENITTLYLRAFTQLLWMVQGDIVGEIHSVKCSMSLSSFREKKSFLDLETLGVTMLVKFLGVDIDQIIKKIALNENGSIKYANIFGVNENAVGNIEIGMDIDLADEMVIVGDNATIKVKDDWWNTGYFELKSYDDKFVKKYSYNFEGNGFRYILQELLIMLRDKRSECTRLFRDESEAIVDVINIIDE